MFRKSAMIGCLCLMLLSLSACFATATTASTAPTPTAAVLSDIVHKVAAIYGEQQPQVVSVNPTFAEANAGPLCFVTIQGHFQKDQLHATGLEFSMLTNGTKVWALRAFTPTNSQVWSDATVPVTH